MIPLSLTLKNFLSYGSELQTISFEQYPFICLSGKNGHGKSALLDAMTWAIWGQARKTSGAVRADESLLKLSQKEMFVLLEFMSGDKRYRIKREFVKNNLKGVSTVEFGYLESDDLCISLTEKTIKDTQKSIEKTIGIDFETFLNSAFLRQGSSNEFSKKTPKERKELLARILLLDQYENIKKRATEKVRELTTNKELRTQAQERRVQEKKTFDLLDDKMKQCADLLSHNEQESMQLQNQVARTQELYAKLKGEVWYLEKEQEKIEQKQKEYARIIKELYGARDVWKQLLVRRNSGQNLSLFLTRKTELVQIIQHYENQLNEKLVLERERTKLEQKQMERVHLHEKNMQNLKEQYVVSLEAIKTESRLIENQVALLSSEYASASELVEKSEKKIEFLSREIATQESQEQQVLFLLHRVDKRTNLYQRLLLKKQEYEQSIEEVLAKQRLLSREDRSACPLCQTTLLGDTRKNVHDSLCKQKEELARKCDRIIKLAEKVKQYLLLHQTIKKKTGELAQKKDESKKNLQHILSSCEQQKELIRKNKDQSAILQDKRKLLLQEEIKIKQTITVSLVSLEKDEQFLEIIKNIKEAEYKIQHNAYHEEAHKQIKQELVDLESVIEKIRAEDVLQQMSIVKERVRGFCATLKQLKREIKEIESTKEKYQALREKEKMVSELLRADQERLRSLLQRKDVLMQETGKLQVQYTQRDQLIHIYNEEEKQLSKIQKDIGEYAMIAHATGKDGIQALLIEQAIPEIEYEANMLLSRLSQNQMHVFIESVKDLKSGKVKETLDIKISDTEGVRPYELFSGGEAFRIDLALRIALSKLLAHRSGVALETLIIDEGFGSQDEEGIFLIIDALYKIQSDFKKIILVSHLSQIKEHIPVHFIVSKTAHGSTISIVEG